MVIRRDPISFVYGTLRDPDVLTAVLGHTHVRGEPAEAEGHATVLYPGRTYPALVASPGLFAPGLLLSSLTSFDLDRLDAFESDEYWRASISVTAAGGHIAAQTYLPAIAIPADAAPWSLDAWTQRHKTDMLGALQSPLISRQNAQPPQR